MDTLQFNETAKESRSGSDSFGSPVASIEMLQGILSRGFGIRFSFFDGETGNLLSPIVDLPSYDTPVICELARQIALRDEESIIAESGPIVILAIPFSVEEKSRKLVAIAPFLIGLPPTGEVDVHTKSDATALLIDYAQEAGIEIETKAAVDTLTAWATRTKVDDPETLLRIARMSRDLFFADRQSDNLREEANQLANDLSQTYEEICLFHRLASYLKLSSTPKELADIAKNWLLEVLPVESIVAEVDIPTTDNNVPDDPIDDMSVWTTNENCPLDRDGYNKFIEHLTEQGRFEHGVPVVINRSNAATNDWPFPEVRQAIVVPIAEGEHHYGYLAAFNSIREPDSVGRSGIPVPQSEELGSVEASMLSSVAGMLGIHASNIDLYAQQTGLTAGIIRALTSTIDAKDQYTCGHSDRVAQIAVRLGSELGIPDSELHTLYLSGLLHDIGKIGIDDYVLRKPDRLTVKEYEHIKKHVTIGHKILRDLPKMEEVLPVVLHHHESWDGSGYPSQLAGETIPLMARIVAVADSFDAMSSNRPYRKGLPDEKIDQIFREGAGRQWDPAVIEALFTAREEIGNITSSDEEVPEPIAEY